MGFCTELPGSSAECCVIPIYFILFLVLGVDGGFVKKKWSRFQIGEAFFGVCFIFCYTLAPPLAMLRYWVLKSDLFLLLNETSMTFVLFRFILY